MSSDNAILPLLVTITLIAFSVIFYLFSCSMGIKDGVVVADADADADADAGNNSKGTNDATTTEDGKEIETTTTTTTSTTTTTTTICDDDDDEIIQICYGIGDGEEIIEGTVTLGETTTATATEEEEEEEEEETYGEKKKKKVEEEEEEEDTKEKSKTKINNVISYYHQAATNRKPNVKIHHIVLLHGQRFTKENWKTSGIISMFNKQFPSIAVTACNLSCDADHYTLIDLLDKLESEGIISLPLSGLVTPSASGKTITDWLCEQIVNDDDDDDDDDDDSTVVTEDDEDDEDDDEDDEDKKGKNKKEDEGEEKDDDDDDDEEEETAANEGEGKGKEKENDNDNDNKAEDDDDDDDKEKDKEDTEKIPLPLNLNILPQYVRRWIPVASYSVMNCTKNQLRLLGALTVCGENNDNDNDNDNDDENNSNNNNNTNTNNSKAFNILAIYGNYDEGGSIVSKRLEKYTYAKIEKLNGRHPVYLDSPDEFVPAIGWAII